MSSQDNIVNSYLSYLQKYYEGLKSDQIILLYEGEVSHQVVLSFTALLESRLLKNNEKNKVQKKIFNVVVEVLQNIYNHGSPSLEDDIAGPGRGGIVIWSDDNYYHIVSGNIINSGIAKKLKRVIDEINGLDRSRLRENYKVQLAEGRFSSKGGAGLGFLDMARKSGNKIGYDFIKFDKKLSFFINSYKVSK